jgi:hypothetical protein
VYNDATFELVDIADYGLAQLECHSPIVGSY